MGPKRHDAKVDEGSYVGRKCADVKSHMSKVLKATWSEKVIPPASAYI